MMRPVHNPLLKDSVTRLYRDSYWSIFVIPLFFSLIALNFWGVISSAILLIWYIYVLLACMMRIWLYYRFSRLNIKYADEEKWFLYYAVSAIAVATGWGSLAFFPQIFSTPFDTVFVSLMIAGVMGGATGTLSASRKLHAVFIGTVSLPLVARYLAHGGAQNTTIAAIILFYGLIMTFVVRRIGRELKDTLNVRALNRKLMRNLLESIGDYKQVNSQLEQKVADELLAQNTLEEVNELQEAIMQSASNALFVMDRSGEFLRINRAGCELLDYRHEELFGQPYLFVFAFDSIDLFADSFVAAALEGQATNRAQIRMRKKDQSELTVQYSLRPLHKKSAIVGVVATVEDITQRHRLETFQRGRVHIMEMLAEGESLEVILMHLLQNAEESNRDLMTGLLFADEDNRVLHNAISPRLAPKFIEKLQPFKIDPEEASSGAAAYYKRRIIVEDIGTEKKCIKYREAAKEYGLMSCWSQPIIGLDDNVLGTIDIYSKHNCVPHPNDIQLIEECAQIARIAIERKRMEWELLVKNRELSLLFHASSVISNTIELDRIIDKVTSLIGEMEVLPVEKKMKIFLMEEGSLKLKYHQGMDNSKDPCYKVKLGECLCGKAARTGRIISIQNAVQSKRHTKSIAKGENHGHIIIPLKGQSGVTGVLCLFTVVNITVEKHVLSLLESLGNLIGMALDNARLYGEVKTLSLRDSLTGLANRRHLDLMIDKMMPRAQRRDIKISVIIFDIDHFKRYNDTHGHIAGDELLIKMARTMENEVRDSDLIVRYGGEEFLLVLPDQSARGALRIAERIRKQVKEEINVGVSGGVAEYKNQERFEELIYQADAALYQAKNDGRDRVYLAPRYSAPAVPAIKIPKENANK